MNSAPDPFLAAPADDAHRDAFNAAFGELGLKWHWDPDTYRSLGHLATDKERIRTYLETRQAYLLNTYDPEFLVDAIFAAKTRRHEAAVAGSAVNAGAGRPEIRCMGACARS